MVIDAVGRPETRKQPGGHGRLGGCPHTRDAHRHAAGRLFSRGGALTSSWYGECLTERDFPAMVALYQQGRLPLEKFVTERIGLHDVEAAVHAIHDGQTLRSVVVLDHP